MSYSLHFYTVGHCRVINWLNVTIVVTQGTGRSEERERNREQPVSAEQPEHKQHLQVKFAASIICGASKQLYQ